MTRPSLVLPILALLIATTGERAHAQHVDAAPLTHGTLSFDASATLGAFTGVTQSVAGQLETAASLADAGGWVTTPAASLTTHNGHRDRDMAASLDVAHFPTIRFDLDGVMTGSSDGDSMAAVLHGRFTIHGRTRADSVIGWIWVGHDSTRFRGSTQLDVKDYDIGGLSRALGMLRMHPSIVVHVDVVFGG